MDAHLQAAHAGLKSYGEVIGHGERELNRVLAKADASLFCGVFPMPNAEHLSMKTIKTFPTSVEADLARIALDAAGIPAFVVGISLGMEGGGAGVRLLVPDDRVEEALTVLGNA